jgi:uroporphyrinogen-III decarboxylase
MNARERLFAALEDRPVDRVPMWLLFPYHRVGYYADVRANPCYAELFELSKRYCVMLNRRHLGARLFTPDVVEFDENLIEDGWQIARHTFAHKGARLTSETRRRGDEVRVKKLLETEADLDVLLSFPVNTDPKAIAAELDAQLPQYQREKAEFPQECGAMMLDLGEPIGFLYHSSRLEEYAVWSAACNEKVLAFLDRAMERTRHVYRYCLARDLADVYFLVGSELASPPLVSPATFRQWIVPYAKELIGMIHAHGKKAIQHFHGQIRHILPDFLTMGADALHTIEAPPVGNCTFTQAFEIVGRNMALIGNIQYDDFHAFTPEQMAAAVRAVLDECRGQRLILSPSAGPYEEHIPQRVIENYRTFMETGWAYGQQ